MPTAKSIPVPPGSAKERLKKQQAEVARSHDPANSPEMKSARERLQLHKDAGVDLITPDTLEKVQAQAKGTAELQAELMAAIAKANDAPAVSVPSVEVAAPVQLDMLAEILKPFSFRIAGRRIITMGPPSYCTQTIVGKILDQREVINLDLEASIKLARVMCYVRAIDGVVQTMVPRTWDDVMLIANQLGELGVRACLSVYEYRWPDSGATLWEEVKN